MKERHILFSAPMVLAILEGRKTMTRRILTPQPDAVEEHPFLSGPKTGSLYQTLRCYDRPKKYADCASGFGLWCPGPFNLKGNKGDRLWVKETWRPDYGGIIPSGKTFINVQYRADGSGRDCWNVDVGGQATVTFPDKWKPSIFMPRWASRLVLEIDRNWVERLNAISEEDAKSEGVGSIAEFRSLWESLNGKCSWNLNPWVQAITFHRVITED